ncbi:MAG: glycosyltransferase family 4 protein [Candidatus Helarchaeota archaeon]
MDCGRIGLNLYFLSPHRKAGLFTYTLGLLNGLRSFGNNIDLVIFTNREAAGYLREQGFKWKIVSHYLPGARPLVRFFYEQVLLNYLSKKHKIDVLHSLAYWGPIFYSGSTVITLPDLNAIMAPESVSIYTRLAWRILVGRSVKKAKKVITISNFSKMQIAEYFKIPLDRIKVTCLAPKPHVSIDSKISIQIIHKFSIKPGYILCVSSLYPHKNIRSLIRAYSSLVKKHSYIPDMVLVGAKRSNYKNIKSLIRKLVIQNRIHLTGSISDFYLFAFYQEAALFVFPSRYEGFGMPVLEAMCYGMPVVVSRAASLPEVTGDAALFFDPYDIDDIASKIYQVLQDKELRQTLVRKGYKNIERFTWENTAKQTIEVYKNVYKSI